MACHCGRTHDIAATAAADILCYNGAIILKTIQPNHWLHIFQQLESFLPENDACNPYNPNDTDNEDSDSDTEQDGVIIVDADTNIKVSKKPIILLVKLWNSVQFCRVQQ